MSSENDFYNKRIDAVKRHERLASYAYTVLILSLVVLLGAKWTGFIE